MFLSSFIVMGLVLADEHHYKYPSDSYRNNQQSQQNASENVFIQSSYSPVQYRYAPLTKEPGSNPYFHSSNSSSRYAAKLYADDIGGPYKAPELSSAGYSYLPPIQKHGSNPYYREQNHYAINHERFTQKRDQQEEISVNIDATKHSLQLGKSYTYPPLTKKLGSNPITDARQYYRDTQSEISANIISEADQKKYRYLYFYQSQPRYIESDNSYMSYTDTHLMSH